MLVLTVLTGAARAGSVQTPCPVTAGELTALTGKALQRVNLGDPDGNRAAQCSFSSVVKNAAAPFVSPQVFVTFEPGGAADLRDLYLYYVQVRGKLATRPRVALRPDLGPGAFALTASTAPVSTAFFLAEKNGIATLVVDLANAAPGKRDQATAEKIFSLVIGRLS